ncbi:hypothetical protein SCHPADRAFT_558909 [Schizopora paradoxa]|uniref:F-box domain-containing protein n=1 Tax=Schizopora paradoxa TaxID=27342 RepID=A0A0H2RDM6_9AGAM|nr:hypothetical protein SCHPADRAFT_558909 [Schizopora paradoxa]
MFLSGKGQETQRSMPLDVKTMDNVSKLQVAEDVKILVLNYLEGGGVFAKIEEEEKYLDTITFNGLLNHEVTRDESKKGFAPVFRARHISSRLGMIDGILDEISSKLKPKIEPALQRFNKLGSVCGLASLPPEVLSLVFSFVIHGFPSPKEHRSLISVRLSHVCQHFRRIIISNPRFWTTISTTAYKPEMRLVQACLERSQNCPLDIHVNIYASPVPPPDIEITPLMQQVWPYGMPSILKHIECDRAFFAFLPHILRWRSVHFHFIEAFGFKGSSDFFEDMRDTHFPSLDTLTVTHDHNDISRLENMGIASSWSTPTVTTLVLYDRLLVPLQSLAGVTTLDVGYSEPELAIEMLKTLIEMSSMSDLRIDISKLDYRSSTSDAEDLHALENIDIGIVEKFEFVFLSNDVAEERPNGLHFVRTFLSKLYLPNAVTLSFKAVDSKHYSGKPLSLDRFLHDISERFPRAITCNINVTRGEPRTPRSATYLPFNFPANLETLRVVCDTCLAFSRKDAEEETAPTASKIRRITLGVNSTKSIDTRDAIHWIRWMKERMQKYGGWDFFENLIILKGVDIKESYSLETVFEYEKVIPREEMDEWCKSTYVFPEIAMGLSDLESRMRSYKLWNEGWMRIESGFRPPPNRPSNLDV